MQFRVTTFERKPYKKLTPKQQKEVEHFFEGTAKEILGNSSFTLYDRLDPLVHSGEKPWEIHLPEK